MKTIIASICALLLLTTLSSGQAITKEERKKSLDLLIESQAKLSRITKGLTEEQLSFKPADDRWSIKNNVDHLVNVENRVWDIVNKSLKVSGEGQKSEISDEEFIRRLSTREVNFKAPKILQPMDEKYATFGDALKAFAESRARTIDFMKSTQENLRGHFSQNPVYGNLDAYQWTLHVSAHAYRHIEQVEEILAHSNFPKK